MTSERKIESGFISLSTIFFATEKMMTKKNGIIRLQIGKTSWIRIQIPAEANAAAKEPRVLPSRRVKYRARRRKITRVRNIGKAKLFVPEVSRNRNMVTKIPNPISPLKHQSVFMAPPEIDWECVKKLPKLKQIGKL